jgi:hypothetical protein
VPLCLCLFYNARKSCRVSQSVSLPVCQSVSFSVCQSVSQSLCLSVSQSLCLSVSQSFSLSVSQSVASVSTVRLVVSVSWSVSRSVSQSVSHSVTKSVSQSVSQSVSRFCNDSTFSRMCQPVASFIICLLVLLYGFVLTKVSNSGVGLSQENWLVRLKCSECEVV